MQPTQGVWYPSEVAPHLFFVDGELSGMATAIPRLNGEALEWRAFDMRGSVDASVDPVFLGKFGDIASAKVQIERRVLGGRSNNA